MNTQPALAGSPAMTFPSRPVCPQCRAALHLHNTRIDQSGGNAEPEEVAVYFCINHGFYRVSESQPLKPGM